MKENHTHDTFFLTSLHFSPPSAHQANTMNGLKPVNQDLSDVGLKEDESGVLLPQNDSISDDSDGQEVGQEKDEEEEEENDGEGDEEVEAHNVNINEEDDQW